MGDKNPKSKQRGEQQKTAAKVAGKAATQTKLNKSNSTLTSSKKK